MHHLIANWPWLYAAIVTVACAATILIGTRKVRRDAELDRLEAVSHQRRARNPRP